MRENEKERYNCILDKDQCKEFWETGGQSWDCQGSLCLSSWNPSMAL